MHTSIPEYLKKAHCLPFLLSHKNVVFRMKLSVCIIRENILKNYTDFVKNIIIHTHNIKIYKEYILLRTICILLNIPQWFSDRDIQCVILK